MIIHGAHNSDTSDLYKNGKHVSKVIRNGKTIDNVREIAHI